MNIKASSSSLLNFILLVLSSPCLSIYKNCVGIFKQSMGARHREGIGLSFRQARLHSLAELVPWIDSWAP